jgi:hypothetical protein
VAAVDQPKVTDGTWIRPGGVVVERSFAQAADLRLGQTITLNGHPFQVAGVAVTAAFHGFPGVSLIWATEAAARSLATKADPLSYISNLKLSDASPRAVNAFVNAYGLKYGAPADATAPSLTPGPRSPTGTPASCAPTRPSSLPAPCCSAFWPSRAWPSSSVAAWQKAPGGSDC